MGKNQGQILILLAGTVAGLIAGRFGLSYGFLFGAAAVLPLALMLLPAMGLYLVAAYSILDYGFRVFAGGLLAGPWDELLFIAIVGGFIANGIITGKGFRYRLTPLDVPIFIFAGVSLFLLIINSPELFVAIDGIRVVLQHLLWYFVVVNIVQDRVSAKRALNYLVLLIGLIAMHGIYQYLIGVEIPTTWYDSRYETNITTRVYSIIGSPNILGSLMVLTIPIAMSFGLNARKVGSKGFYFGLVGVMLLSLVFTFSRGAWLAFGLAIFVYALLKDKRLLLPIGLVAVVLLVAVPQIGDRITYMLSPQYLESSATGGRIYRWTVTLANIRENPLFGLGLGRFGGATAMRHIPGSFYADNFYLKTMAEMGLIGFTAFAYLLYRGCVEVWRVIGQTRDKEFFSLGIGIFAGLMGVLAHNAVENVFEVPMMVTYFWTLVAIMISLRSLGITGSNGVKYNDD